MTVEMRDRFRGCLLGLAAGDAVGTSVEFSPRGTFAPITDMIGGGPFRLLPGQWTDDTSMALCLAESLCETRGFDADDQMRRYWRWYQEGYRSSTGECFDIGGTVAAALRRYRRDGNPFAGSADPDAAGNGSIMRLAPVPMYYFSDIALAERYAVESSRTTHATPECVDACRLLARMIVRALRGDSRPGVVQGDADTFEGSEAIVRLARGEFRRKSEAEVRGSGYVVESLEAALWCFESTSSFEQAILRAVNLGDDADTTAAVCGQIAGAYYGQSGIPQHWVSLLAGRNEIVALADRLHAAASEVDGLVGFES